MFAISSDVGTEPARSCLTGDPRKLYSFFPRLDPTRTIDGDIVHLSARQIYPLKMVRSAPSISTTCNPCFRVFSELPDFLATKKDQGPKGRDRRYPRPSSY